MIILLLSAAASLSPSTLLPVNFWLLRQANVVSTDEDTLVGNYIASLNAGDVDAAESNLASISERPIAVEFEDTSARTSTVTTLPDGTTAEELSYNGPRTLLLPGSMLTRIEELDYGDGGLGARVWDAAIGLGIWLSRVDVVRDQTVLELGSGVGLGGISAALAGAASVTLTEVAADAAPQEAAEQAELGGAVLLATLAANAALNAVDATTTVQPLDWCDCMVEGYAPDATYPVVLGADLVHDEKYSLPALCAAVVTHTAPGGAAYLMCAKGRPGVDALPDALLRCAGGSRSSSSSTSSTSGSSSAGEAEGGAASVKVEEMCVMNSYGVADMVLVTYRPGGE